jgi:hypothetical protein
MADAPVAAQIHQPLDIHRHFSAKVPLDGVFGNFGAKLVDFFFREVLNSRLRGNPGGIADLRGSVAPDPVDSGEGNDSMFPVWNIDTGDTGHRLLSPAAPVRRAKALNGTRFQRNVNERKSALTLLVLWIPANHADDAVAPNDLAIAADLFH